MRNSASKDSSPSQGLRMPSGSKAGSEVSSENPLSGTRKVIGVMGYSGNASEKQRKAAFEVGRQIALRGFVLLTGATTGVPLEAARGAKEENGLVVGISPASNMEEHQEKYGMPLRHHDVIIYTGLGKQGRNVVNIKSSDAVIIIGGSVGTLNEFTAAYATSKLIGVLEGSGGIAEIIPEITRRFDNRFSPTILYSKSPKELVGRIASLIRKKG